MPRRGKANLRVRGKVTNIIHAMDSLRKTADATDDLLDSALGQLARDSVELLRGVAPQGRSKQLWRGIKARRRGARGIDVTVHAVAPETGYDYAWVTRFGHQVEEITPTEGRQALRIRFQSGDVGFFNRVRGFKPAGDWVDHAIPAIGLKAEEVMNEVGRELELRLFS